MAAGVAIVATDLPGYRTVLTPGAQGLAVPPRNSDQLRRALETVLGSPDLRREMGARGVETSRRYAWPLIVEKLEEIYRVVLGGARTAGSLDDSRERVVALEPAQA